VTDEVNEGIIQLSIQMKTISRARNLRKNSTPQEIILWSRLKNRNFKNLKFRRQYSIGKYIVDFICLEKKLIIELDGWQHKEENQERYDQERTKFFEKLGFKVLRFWNNEVNDNLAGVFLKVDEEL
jgi:very-short-patch-repair endonuclease